MLTRLIVRRFKALEVAEIPLGQNVVLIRAEQLGQDDSASSAVVVAERSAGMAVATVERQPSRNANGRYAEQT